VLRADPSWENQYLGSGGASGILIASLDKPELASYQGRRLDEIARTTGNDPLEALMDLIHADITTGLGIMFMMREDDVRAALRHPLVAMGTDTGAHATDGLTASSASHPRGWGSATRIQGTYVREEGLLTLEEAVRKMTSVPAARMKLWDRGLVRSGFVADLTVFNPATVRDRSTFTAPRAYSEGIHQVMVNGEFVVDEGRITNARPGRVVYGPGYRGARAAGAVSSK
jgi:N-acyl-D-amino-acid deacylase